MRIYRQSKLIRESEWMRVYEFQGSEVYESKFLSDGLQVSADSIRRRWKDLSSQEKLELAQAFQAKPEVTPEDEEILNYLMQVADPGIWMTIAPLLPRHSDRDRALGFLLERIKEAGQWKANYYQTVGRMNDKRAVAVLRAAYNGYRKMFDAHGKPSGDFDYLDYLTCCKALWSIEGSTEYREAIEQLARSEDEKVRVWAEKMLRDK